MRLIRFPFWLFFRCLRTFLRFFRDADGALTWIFDRLFPKEYQLRGQCKKRGVCCTNIGVMLKDGDKTPRWLYRLAVWWYTFVYNFEFLGQAEGEPVLLFRCHYLKGNQCSIHWKRPFICRNYPLRRYFGKPAILPGCGYYFERRSKI